MTKNKTFKADADLPLTVTEAAQILRCGRALVLRLLNSGELKGRKVGRSWRISRDAITNFVNGQ